MKHFHTFESFLKESFLFEAARPVPRNWDNISQAQYKKELEVLLDFFKKDWKERNYEDLPPLAIWDWQKSDTKSQEIPLESGKRPPICPGGTIDPRYPAINKEVVSGIDASAIIGEPIKLKSFEVAQHDFPSEMNWYEAEYCCVQLGNGWYLPNEKQIKEITSAWQDLGLAKANYWGSGSTRYNNQWNYYNSSGKQPASLQGAAEWKFLCRAIKA